VGFELRPADAVASEAGRYAQPALP
jgi:hypothetical protein